MSSGKKKTTEEFIKEAREIHGDKYDYSKTVYTGSHKEVIITCPIHGDFPQIAHNHIHNKNGCPDCAKEEKFSNTEEFIEKARKVHGDKYNYDKVEYIKASEPVIITCPIHGDFPQTPNDHLHGSGCKKCGGNYSPTTEEFIEKAREIHGDKYDYSKTVYTGAEEYVTITCPIHGDFQQTPHKHLYGGCWECGVEKRANNIRLKNKEKFIEKARKVHGDKYNYDKVEYIKAKDNVIITCPIHGDFPQTPNKHLCGHGCPKCNGSRLEEELRVFLKSNKIKYKEQTTWEWLVYESNQKVDFYLPDFNIVIEAQGLQHFKEIEFFDKDSSLEKRIDMDNNKRNLCIEHGIKVYYYSNIIKDKQVDEGFEYPYKVFEDIEELFKTIKEDFNKENPSD